MLIEERRWTPESGWTVESRPQAIPDAQFVLMMGPGWAIEGSGARQMVNRLYPDAEVRVVESERQDSFAVCVAARVELSEVLGGSRGMWEVAVA